MKVYLDHNATSPLRAEAMDAMGPWFGRPANPASAHTFGREAAAAVERAREQVAALVGGRPEGVVFTSGATESNQMALVGGALLREGPVWVSAVEHPCVQAAADRLALQGREVHRMAVGGDGVVDVETRTAGVVALLAVQHETGVIQPVEALAGWRGSTGSGAPWVHVDGTQGAGRIVLSMRGIDSMALSAHKIGGPAGVGALILRDGDAFPPLFPGVQERGRRGGSVNVAGVVGFGAACAVAATEVGYGAAQQRRLESALGDLGGRVIGSGASRAGNTTLVVFPGLRGDAVVQALDLRGVYVSAGAACASGSARPSPTLSAMRDPEPSGGVRFSQGPATTIEEIDHTIHVLREALVGLRTERSLADWLGAD